MHICLFFFFVHSLNDIKVLLSYICRWNYYLLVRMHPDNTLFPALSSFCISFSDLETYLPLVLGLFELAPFGSMVEIIPFFR